MTDDNIFTTSNYLDVILGGKGSVLNKDLVVERVTNGADIKPGMFVGEVGETDPAIDLADGSSDTTFLGVAWKHANEEDIPVDWQKDASSPLAFATLTRVLVILPHAMKLLIAAYIAPNPTTTAANDIVGNELLALSAGAAAANAGELDVVTDNTSITVGRAHSRAVVTGNAADAKVVEMWY